MEGQLYTDDRSVRERKVIFWCMALLCVMTLIPFLGFADYNTKGEPREAVVSLSMLQTGNWILPLNNGGEMPYKPPFFHWLVAICSVLTGGEVTAFSSRLPSAIALIAMTLGTYLFFAPKRGNWLAAGAAMVAFTTIELHRTAMNTRVDMVLTALTVGAILLLYDWGEKGMRRIPWLAILMMSAATLTKGPVGVLVPCLVIGIYMLLRGRNFFRVFILLVVWGVASLILPFCWYAAAYQQGGSEFLDLVMEENFGRMTSTMSYDSCVNPWPYLIAVTLGGFMPWTVAAALSLFVVHWKSIYFVKPAEAWSRFKGWLKGMAPDRLLSLTAVIVIFVFYCIPQSKRSVYLMPLYPFLALFVAELMLWMGRRRVACLKGFGDFLSALAILLTATFIAVKCGVVPDSLLNHGRHGDDNVAMLHAIESVGGLAWGWVAVAPAGAVLWWTLWRNRLTEKKLLVAETVVVCGIFISLGGAYQPAVLNVRSARPVAAQVERMIPASEGTLYEFISWGEFAAGDPVHYFELNFYLGDRIRNFVKERPASGFLVISDRDAADYMQQFEANGYTLTPLFATEGKLMKEPTHIYRFIRSGKTAEPVVLHEVKND